MTFWNTFSEKILFSDGCTIWIPLLYALCWANPGASFLKSGSRILIAKQNRTGGENKNRAQKINTYLALICQLCGKLLRPAIWWFHITSLGSNVPRCSVTTKSFIRRFLGSFSCDYILTNNRSLVNMLCTDFSSSQPHTHFEVPGICELGPQKTANSV